MMTEKSFYSSIFNIIGTYRPFNKKIKQKKIVPLTDITFIKKINNNFMGKKGKNTNI